MASTGAGSPESHLDGSEGHSGGSERFRDNGRTCVLCYLCIFKVVRLCFICLLWYYSLSTD